MDLTLQEEVARTFEELGKIKAMLAAMPNDGIKKAELEQVVADFTAKFAALEEQRKVALLPVQKEEEKIGPFEMHKFLRMVKDGDRAGIAREYKTITEATEGAAVVPTMFLPKIIETMLNSSIVAGKCMPMSMATNKTDVPNISTDVSVAFVTEAGGVTLQTPVLGKITPQLGKIVAAMLVTQEQLQDEQIDMTPFWQKRIGLKAGQALDAAILEHTAAGDLPNGIKTVAGVNSTTYTAPIDDEDLIDLQNKQTVEAYHTNAEWFFNRACLSILMKLKDDNGQPLFGSLVNGIPTSLLGKKFNLTDQIAGAGTTASKTSIYYGDMQNAWLLSHSKYPNMTVEMSNSVVAPNPTPTINAFLQSLLGFRFNLRKGFIIAVPAAFTRGLNVYK